MSNRIAQHFRSNVVGYVALFVSLSGGAAYASTYVVSSNSQIGPGTVSGHAPPAGRHANLIGGSVNGSDLASNAVTGAKVATGSLRGSDIGNDSITGSQVNEGSLDPNVLQRRITTTCPNGTAMVQVGQDGNALCWQTLSGVPAVSIHGSASIDATSASGAFLPATGEAFDPTNMHDESANGDCSKEPNNCEIVVTTPGIYSVHADTGWEFFPSFCAAGEDFPRQTAVFIYTAAGDLRDSLEDNEPVACDAYAGSAIDQEVSGLKQLQAGDRLMVWVHGPDLGPQVALSELSAVLVSQ